MSDKVIVICHCSGWRHGEIKSWQEQYVGTILPNYPIDGADVISLSTDLPASHGFPRRIIAKKDIISMERADTKEAITFTQPVEAVKTYQVKGSKGDIYTVKQNGSRFTCDCTGYAFRKTCKHIVSIKNS